MSSENKIEFCIAEFYKGMWGIGVQKSSVCSPNQRLGRGNRIALYMCIGHKHRKAKIYLSWCLIKLLNDDTGGKKLHSIVLFYMFVFIIAQRN